VRVAVVDIGTNSTRLLLAEVDDGRVAERERRTTITRLGQGVDRTGALAPEAMDRVFAALGAYRDVIAGGGGADRTVGVLTSAVRDASNGADFTAAVRDRFGVDARTIPGEEEARLTFLGATSEHSGGAGRVVVIDIGGGSTEFVVGAGDDVGFFTSTQAGVVRMTERHIAHDPPHDDELQAVAADARAVFAAGLPAEARDGVADAIAVAGTATSLAAIDQDLEPYDPERVHGHRLSRATIDRLARRLAALPEAERRAVRGLHPDRAPTIVAGALLLGEALDAFGLDGTEVSEHDILRGAALDAAAASS
jgi:exopolyphosphatase/guanosine-5'-triphosphate,3'-diphosphate pyrophosphatase